METVLIVPVREARRQEIRRRRPVRLPPGFRHAGNPDGRLLCETGAFLTCKRAKRLFFAPPPPPCVSQPLLTSARQEGKYLFLSPLVFGFRKGDPLSTMCAVKGTSKNWALVVLLAKRKLVPLLRKYVLSMWGCRGKIAKSTYICIPFLTQTLLKLLSPSMP